MRAMNVLLEKFRNYLLEKKSIRAEVAGTSIMIDPIVQQNRDCRVQQAAG